MINYCEKIWNFSILKFWQKPSTTSNDTFNKSHQKSHPGLDDKIVKTSRKKQKRMPKNPVKSFWFRVFLVILCFCGQSGRSSVTIPITVVFVVKSMTPWPWMMRDTMNETEGKCSNKIRFLGAKQALMTAIVHQWKTSAHQKDDQNKQNGNRKNG